jgi:preprotein translocase subunit SecD
LAFRRSGRARACWRSITDRIHLGLDLRGGTHLILQVQVNDAVNVDSDNAIARLKEDMRTHKINYADITKPDPVNHPEMIVVKGVPPEQTSDFKSIVADRLPDIRRPRGRRIRGRCR